MNLLELLILFLIAATSYYLLAATFLFASTRVCCCCYSVFPFPAFMFLWYQISDKVKIPLQWQKAPIGQPMRRTRSLEISSKYENSYHRSDGNGPLFLFILKFTKFKAGKCIGTSVFLNKTYQIFSTIANC